MKLVDGPICWVLYANYLMDWFFDGWKIVKKCTFIEFLLSYLQQFSYSFLYILHLKNFG